MRFPIGLVAYFRIYQATRETNARGKTDVATKMLQIIKITSILHTSDGKNDRTQKVQVLWN